MRFIPHTSDNRKEMLAAIGLTGVAELFSDIPQRYILDKPLSIEPASSEPDLIRFLTALSNQNADVGRSTGFMGGGAYSHFIPSVVPALMSRSEFVTAYTPYQPEISQGTLQAIFEYQTMMTQLTGLPISNASLYDGAMAAAESALLALRVSQKSRIAVSRALNPGHRATIATYCRNQNIGIIEIPMGTDGGTQREACRELIADGVGCIVIQSPNYFGVIEDQAAFAAQTAGSTCQLVTVVTEALSLGILQSPGECGADIACGDAQSLGLPLSFGGPYLGFLTCKEKFVRQAPGRLVGMTRDSEGRLGFVNTLSTREQHIRREKATSNICTNQALCAVTASVYMATMGPEGLRQTAALNLKKAHYLRSHLSRIAGYRLPFSGPVFNEFVLQVPSSVQQFQDFMTSNGVFPGIDMSHDFPELGAALLVCATEVNTREQLDRYLILAQTFTKEARS